jgi:acetyl esterase/lipase
MLNTLKKYAPPLFELSGFPLRSGPMYMREAIVPLAADVRFGRHRRQYLLHYRPLPGVLPRPEWVMFFHGGGWHVGRPAMFPQIIDYFVSQGYHVVLPAYRLCPGYTFPDMRTDISAALATTLDLMEQETGRQQPIIVGGMSAGATLAAHLVFDTAAFRTYNNGVEADFAGFMSCGGPLDLLQMPDTFVVRHFTGGPYNSPAFHAANPIRLLTPDTRPIPAFFLHGTKDTIVPMKSNYSFYDKYRQIAPVWWHTLEGGVHIDSIRWINDDVETGEHLRQWLATL